MNILISHVYSIDNKGDAALLDVLIQEVRKQFKNSNITILNMDEIKQGELFEGVPMMHSFMYLINAKSSNPIWWLLYGNTMMLYSLLVASVRHKIGVQLPIARTWRQLINQYADTDLVITVGGGYLRTKPSLGSIYDFMQLLHPIALAHGLGTPTVLYTQSIGPVHRRLERLLLRHVLNHNASLVIAREDKSLRLLQTIGVKHLNRSVDAGFLLRSGPNIRPGTMIHVPKNQLIVGVTSRRWLDPKAQTNYEQALAKVLDYMVTRHNAYIVFIPQVTAEFHTDDDRITNQAIFDSMRHQQQAIVLQENYDHRQLKALYDQLHILLGTRFHSVIFSLTSLVPAVAIEYEYKTSGIMHDLDLNEWVIKMENVTFDTLKPKMDALVKQRQTYKKHLQQVLPSYIQQAHEAIIFTAEAYEQSKQL